MIIARFIAAAITFCLTWAAFYGTVVLFKIAAGLSLFFAVPVTIALLIVAFMGVVTFAGTIGILFGADT